MRKAKNNLSSIFQSIRDFFKLRRQTRSHPKYIFYWGVKTEKRYVLHVRINMLLSDGAREFIEKNIEQPIIILDRRLESR